MGKQANRKLIGYLPLVCAATFVVVLAPMLLVLWLRESGAVDSMWVALVIGVGMSLVASQAGAALWKAKANSELIFSELMLWGWLQRWRSERRLTRATDLLGLSVGRPTAVTGGHLSSPEKTQLLTQLTSSLEAADPYTHGHSRRVARHAANIAKQMGLSGGEIAKIRAAGAMHDVGKVETPTAVLHKAGRLTDEEFAIVQRHPVDGAEMVATLDDDELTAIVRHHHERLDGTGYPDGLAGDEIPLGARILAVADTFDAITSTRPYRQANPHKKALDILATEAGTQLDPDAVRAFLDCYSGMKPVAFWAVLINARPRVSASLSQAFSPAAGTNVLATTAAAAAVGAVGFGPGAHTIPSAAQPVEATKAALLSSSPLWEDAKPGLTTLASLRAEPGAKAAGERASRSAGRSHSGSEPASSDGSDDKAHDAPAPRSSDGQASEQRASNRPSGADDTTTGPGESERGNNGHAYGRDREKGSGTGPGNGNSNGKGNGQGNGNAQPNGQGQGPGNGNAFGHENGNSDGQGQGNANGHDQGQPNGNEGQSNGQGQGQGNSLKTVAVPPES